MFVLRKGLFVVFLALNANIATAQFSPCAPGSPGCSDPYLTGRRDIGDSWWAVGDADFGVTLTSVSTLLQLPQPPESAGDVTLNPAVDNSNPSSGNVLVDNSYEILAAASPTDECNPSEGQWCMLESSFDGNANSSRSKRSTTGPSFAINAGTLVNVTYVYSPENNTISEYIATEGLSEKVATKEVSPIQPFRFWPRTECPCEFQGTIPEHTYHQTVITLSEPVADFNASAQGNNTNEPLMYSTDGGQTWHIDSLTLEASWCNNQARCKTAPT